MIYKTIGLLLAITLSMSSTTISLAQDGQRQSKPDSQTDTVHLRTELVQVQVVVNDKQGKIIEGLKKEDFEVLEQGHPQEVSFFSEERLGGEPVRLPAADKPQVETPPALTTRAAKTARSICLFLDTFHLSGPSLIRVKDSLKKFVDERVTDQDTVLVASTNGVFGIFQNPVQERLAIKRLIERINYFDTAGRSNFTPYLASMVKLGDKNAADVALQVWLSEEGAIVGSRLMAQSAVRAKASEVLEIAAYRRQSALSVLSAVIERLAEMPGQRLLMMLSDGFTMRDTYGNQDTGGVQSVISKAVRLSVIFYSIDVKGLEVATQFDASRRPVGGGPQIMGLLTGYMSDSGKDQQDGINALAQDTGGKAFFNTNDLQGAVQKAIDLNRFYYTLAYYPPDAKGEKGFRKITVRVKNHPEYSVRAQKGYLATDLKKAEKELAQSPQQRLMNAIAKPLPVGEIGVTMTADYLEVGSDGDQVSLQAQIDGNTLIYREQEQRNLIELELTAVVFDRTGRSVNSITETIRGAMSIEEMEAAKRTGFHYSKRLPLKPGLYNLRVGLREVGTERIGTAAAWLEVPNLGHGKLTLSSILLTKDSADSAQGVSRGSGRSTGEAVQSYKVGSPLLYYLMIYNSPSATGDPALSMQWEISEAGKVIHSTDWQPVAGRVIGRDKKGIEVGGQLKLTLQPGIYELRIAVTDAKSKQTAQRIVSFAIES